jgi:LysR family hydrogen peroxide-inducible transcriptional activator
MAFAPHPFSLRQLQYVVAVADELSFRRAALRCHVSQPSLSSQLAQVEEALGVRMFERSRKRVLVTVAGRDLVERAKRLLLDADEILEAARRVGDPLAGTIRLGIIPTISPYLLPAVTPHLRKALPRLRIAWFEEKTGAIVRRLADGQIEGAIVALEAEVGDVAREVVANDPFVLVMRPDHPLALKNSPVSQADLRGQELLLLDEGHCFREQALEACGSARAREGEFRATSLSTLVQMVSGGAGITLIPALAVDTEAKRARLHIRALATPAAHRTIALIWRRGSPVEPALRAVGATLRDAYPAAVSFQPQAGVYADDSDVATTKRSVPKQEGDSASQLISERIAELGDWRGETLGRLRALIKEADPDILEEWKWKGTPVWSHSGIVCTGETYKKVVKMTFAKGAFLKDPSGLFNSSLDGNLRRAIDVQEGEKINAPALKALIRAAVALNVSGKKAAPPKSGGR